MKLEKGIRSEATSALKPARRPRWARRPLGGGGWVRERGTGQAGPSRASVGAEPVSCVLCWLYGPCETRLGGVTARPPPHRSGRCRRSAVKPPLSPLSDSSSQVGERRLNFASLDSSLYRPVWRRFTFFLFCYLKIYKFLGGGRTCFTTGSRNEFRRKTFPISLNFIYLTLYI